MVACGLGAELQGEMREHRGSKFRNTELQGEMREHRGSKFRNTVLRGGMVAHVGGSAVDVEETWVIPP